MKRIEEKRNFDIREKEVLFLLARAWDHNCWTFAVRTKARFMTASQRPGIVEK